MSAFVEAFAEDDLSVYRKEVLCHLAEIPPSDGSW